MKVITRTITKKSDFFALLQIARPNSIIHTGLAELHIISRCAGASGNDLHLRSDMGENFTLHASSVFEVLKDRTIKLILDPDPIQTVAIPEENAVTTSVFENYIQILKAHHAELHAQRKNFTSLGCFLYQQIRLAEA